MKHTNINDEIEEYEGSIFDYKDPAVWIGCGALVAFGIGILIIL